jgi:hypothetical protein
MIFICPGMLRTKVGHCNSDSWDQLKESNLVENLYQSMPNRMQSVIEKHGKWTKY